MGTKEIATHLTEYVVNVKTSDRFGAGTDAKVFLQLFGDLGTSEVFSLHHSNNVNKFERNQLDRFVLRDVPAAGKLQSIKIWHDNSGKSHKIKLIQKCVTDFFYFRCRCSLALGLRRSERYESRITVSLSLPRLAIRSG